MGDRQARQKLVSKTAKLPISRQCELLGLNRTGIYYRPVTISQNDIEQKEKIFSRIDYWHTKQPCFGVRRLRRKLAEEGSNLSRKLLRRYMAEMAISAVFPRPNLSKHVPGSKVCPYLLRNKLIYLPNQAWSIDITYISLAHGHMYLTAVIDWYSRMIMGWNLSDTLDTAPVLDTVRSAVATHGIPAILNSDQGCQFTSEEYMALLKQFGIRQSMDGKSRWADNVMIERWFRSLKTECIYINEFSSPHELRTAIRDYVKAYNAERPHQSLGYATPLQTYFSSFVA